MYARGRLDMVVKVYHVVGDMSWLGHEERDDGFGWSCPECKVRYLWSQSWSYIGHSTDKGIAFICLACAQRLGLIW